MVGVHAALARHEALHTAGTLPAGACKEKKALTIKVLAKPRNMPHPLEKHHATGQPGCAGHGEAVLGNGALTATLKSPATACHQGYQCSRTASWVLLRTELPAPWQGRDQSPGTNPGI